MSPQGGFTASCTLKSWSCGAGLNPVVRWVTAAPRCVLLHNLLMHETSSFWCLMLSRQGRLARSCAAPLMRMFVSEHMWSEGFFSFRLISVFRMAKEISKVLMRRTSTPVTTTPCLRQMRSSSTLWTVVRLLTQTLRHLRNRTTAESYLKPPTDQRLPQMLRPNLRPQHPPRQRSLRPRSPALSRSLATLGRPHPATSPPLRQQNLARSSFSTPPLQKNHRPRRKRPPNQHQTRAQSSPSESSS